EDGFVNVDLIDAQGKVAQTLVAEEQASGEYSIHAALARTVPSGSYTLRLQASGVVKTVRVNVVR
ncbi:MAG: hypothetical protein EAZ92_00935, partial [Candidatus Kapaibacterium sp.]